MQAILIAILPDTITVVWSNHGGDDDDDGLVTAAMILATQLPRSIRQHMFWDTIGFSSKRHAHGFRYHAPRDTRSPPVSISISLDFSVVHTSASLDIARYQHAWLSCSLHFCQHHPSTVSPSTMFVCRYCHGAPFATSPRRLDGDAIAGPFSLRVAVRGR